MPNPTVRMENPQLSEIVANCDQEPIHSLGLIQPHGALLCLNAQGILIAQSANAGNWLGVLPKLGEPITEQHLDPAAFAAIHAALSDPNAMNDSVECASAGSAAHRFDLVLHWSAGCLFAEFEQLSVDAPSASQFALYAQRAIQRLQANQYANASALLQATAEAIRTMTGFDRVMGYRFLADGSGEVIGEAHREDLPPYLHQRYPAGDIPPQARRLYVLNPIRQIVSVDATPVSIVPPLRADTHAQYDLSHSVLRSVSPIHIEYLKNMGVGASMSVSIIVDGKLWGLFACHHMTAHRASHAFRMSCTVLTQVVSILITQLESRQRAEAERRVLELRAKVAAELALADDPLAGLVAADNDVVTLVDCEAVIVVVDKEVVALGNACPIDKETVRALADHMAATRLDLFVAPSLRAALPELGAIRTPNGWAAGCLAIQMVSDASMTIIWLRDELVETINWAGPPDKVVASGPNGLRLTPRGSFNVWKQTVRGVSRAWTDLDLMAVRELKAVLQDVALNRMRESERARTTLLATLGHDLRDPLQAINMAVQLMGRGLATSNDTAQRVVGSTKRMQSLINYILDVSRIRSGVGLGLSRERADLHNLLLSIVEQNRLTHPGITISTDLAEDLGEVMVDPDRFNQALTNLISNARKHGDTHFPITLKASVEGDKRRIMLSNRLVGKAPLSFERLTDPFKSGSLDNPNNHGGLGLGLYIARAIVKGHDADLTGVFSDGEARITILLSAAAASS